MLPRLILSSKQIIGGKSLAQWGQLFINHMQSIDLEFDPGHRIDHVMRVTKTAVEIAEQEGANLAIVMPAAILHDTRPVSKFGKERDKASTLSAEDSVNLLRGWGYPEEYMPAIRHAIQAHSFSAKIAAESLEAKVVQDADRLDAIGAIGVARAMAVGFKFGNPLYNASEPFPESRAANDQTNILDHFYIKLFSLPEDLNTAAAKAEGARRIVSMEAYLQALACEIGVNYLSYSDYLKKQNEKFLCAGTFGITNQETMNLLVKNGYKHFDAATAYKGSLQFLGCALANEDRSKFHICAKVNDGDLLKNNFSMRQILDSVLKELNTEYLDTLMLHSPALLLHDQAVKVLEELIKLKEEGKVKHIGVSNFTIKDFERLGTQYLKLIDYNEIELNPYCQQQAVVDYCRQNNIQVMAERALGKDDNDEMLKDPVLVKIAGDHNATVQQVILAWLIQNKIIAIPLANTNEQLQSNLAACNISLNPAVLAGITKLNQDRLTIKWDKFVKIPNFASYMDKSLARPSISKGFGGFAADAASRSAAIEQAPTIRQNKL